MQPLVKVPSINVESEAEVQRSCNCCNNDQCISNCCFPFFRRRHRHSHNHVEQVEKVDKVAKEKLVEPKK